MTFEKTAMPEKSTFQPTLNVSEFGLWTQYFGKIPSPFRREYRSLPFGGKVSGNCKKRKKNESLLTKIFAKRGRGEVGILKKHILRTVGVQNGRP